MQKELEKPTDDTVNITFRNGKDETYGIKLIEIEEAWKGAESSDLAKKGIDRTYVIKTLIDREHDKIQAIKKASEKSEACS